MTFPPLSEQHCANCRYSSPLAWLSPYSHPDQRLCRRHAPQASPYGGVWATTKLDQWCGEWAQEEVQP